MKRLLLIFVLLTVSAIAQNSPVIGNFSDNGPTLPATCVIGQLFSKTSATTALYFCSAANTWTSFGTGSGNVTGPGSSTTGDVTSFADTTGKVLSDSGILATNITRLDTANTGGASMTLNMSAQTTSADALVLPNVAGAAPSTDGSIVFDTTGRDYRGRVNGANATFAVWASGAIPAAGTIPKSASTSTGAQVGTSITDDGKTINSSEVATLGNHLWVTGDFTTAANTSLQTITGLSWTSPASKAVTVSFHCSFNFSQATATAAVAFGVQGATTAPTNINANGTIFSNTTAETTGTLNGLTTTTATAVVSVAPSAITTIWKAEMDGTAELPSNASPTVLNFMVSTATSGDAVTVKRGSYCTLF